MMWVRSVALWIGVLAGVALGQQAMPADGLQGAVAGSVTGVVELGDTRAPAAGANVFLVSSEPPAPKIVDGEYVVTDQPSRDRFNATADAAGRVEMREVPPSEYLVGIRVPGYIAPEEYAAP